MKKIAASLGVLAVGASALQAVESATINNLQQTKPWSVTASLRGFYDDNVATQANKTDSTGFEINPTIDFGLPGEQTSFNLGYGFSAKYYDERPAGITDNWDFTHSFDLALSHTFSPRLSVRASDSFVIGQEPDFLRVGNAASATPQNISGDNIRNYASIDFDIDVTQLLAFNVGYNNTYWDYDNSGPTVAGPLVISPSSSGLFDRMEHNIHLDSLWKISPKTVGIVGYAYSQTEYTGDEAIAGVIGVPGSEVDSDFRNNRGHTFYLGAQQAFTPTLSGTLKVGAQYYDYFNDPSGESQWSPYLQGSLRYVYQTTTSFDAGVSYGRSVANVAGLGGANFVLDTETAVLYGSVRHELTSHLIISGNVMVQRSEYNGGAFDGQSYVYYQLGIDLAYQFNPNLSTHIGYNYDNSDSDVAGNSYDRNRVYLGLTAGF